MLMGFAADSLWHMLVFSYISGINERFIPDKLSKVAKTNE